MKGINKLLNLYQSQNMFSKLFSLIIIVIVIPVFLGFYLSINSMQSLVTKQIRNDSYNSLQFIKYDIQELFTRTASTLLYISDEEMLIELLELQTQNINSTDEKLINVKGIRYLEDVIPKMTYGRIPFHAKITLISTSGVLYSTGFGIEDDLGSNKDFMDYLYELDVNSNHVATEYIKWKTKTSQENSNLNTEMMALKAINHKNKTIGIITISFSEDVLNDIISKASDGFNRFILDEKNNIISSSSNTIDSESVLAYVNQLSDSQGDIITKNRDGKKEIVTYNKIYNTKWTLVEVRPYSQILDGYINTAYLQLLIMIITTIIFIIMSIFIIRSITSPLKRLSRTMINEDLNQEMKHSKPVYSNEIKVLENSYGVMLQNIKSLMQHNIEIEKKKRNAELKALQSQIKPHFLFNTLSVIRFSILSNKSEKAEKMILALIRLLDATIFRNEDLIELKDEIENTKNYVEIIKLRQGIELELFMHVSEELTTYKVPRLILQPIVENSILHGLSSSKTGTISILALKKVEGVIISVADNGCGYECKYNDGIENKKFIFSGVGLKNIDERIKIQYGKEYGITVESEINEGTTVTIMLPS